MRSILSLVIILGLTSPAVAANGVFEINQTCATQTGCFAGDTPGFPVTISASGSYHLTSNLAVSDANTNGIGLLNAGVANVSIDLGGFAIRGPVVCSGTPLACTPSSGTGSGVERLAASNVGFPSGTAASRGWVATASGSGIRRR